jgi:hypothetical protein
MARAPEFGFQVVGLRERMHNSRTEAASRHVVPGSGTRAKRNAESRVDDWVQVVPPSVDETLTPPE